MKYIHILPALLFLSTLAHANGLEQEQQKQYALVFKAQRDTVPHPLITAVPLPCTMDVEVSQPHTPLIILTFSEQPGQENVDALSVVERPTIEYQDVEMFGHFVRAYKVTVTHPACEQSCVVIAAPVSSLEVSLVEFGPKRAQQIKDEIDDIVIDDPNYKPESISHIKLLLMKWGACIFYKLPASVQNLFKK